MTSFRYIVPSTLQSTLQVLNQADPRTQPLAGGTRLLVDLRQGTIQPDKIVDLRLLTELKQIHLREQAVYIGALVSFAQLERDSIIQQHVPLLTHMASSLGNPLIRIAATLGGNIASARTTITDAAVPLVALDAELVLQIGGLDAQVVQRRVSIAEYLLQEPDPRELITCINVPVPLPDSRSFYAKISNRKAGATAIASVAVNITFQDKRITAAHIALGALASRPFRPHRVETLLSGEELPLRETVIDRCLDLLQTDLPEPLHDALNSASYRSAMGCALVRKALKQIDHVDRKEI
jgi:CO/xanthine dehydrogenase FAD-binding subunit